MFKHKLLFFLKLTHFLVNITLTVTFLATNKKLIYRLVCGRDLGACSWYCGLELPGVSNSFKNSKNLHILEYN